MHSFFIFPLDAIHTCPHSCAQLRLSSLQLLPYGYPPRNYEPSRSLLFPYGYPLRNSVTVPSLCSRKVRERAPQKRTCATSAPADARRGTGPERARAAGCAHRRTGAAGGTGRYSDQARCRSWADEARTLRRKGKRGLSDRRASAPARPCQPWRRTPPQPSALRAEARTAIRPHPTAI